jgi:hypothetical protein
MTTLEFSNQFDVLVSSYTRFRDFDDREPRDTIEFDEYEKSLYLTKAQEELVLSLYNGRNSSVLSFEETEELRRYLSNLIKEAELAPIVTTNGKLLGMESTSKFFTLPEDLWFITYESVLLGEGKCESHTSMEVIPVRQDEYHRLKKNPFRGANDRRALRLDLSGGNVEIICKYSITKYYVRYLKKLNPIILVPLPDNLSINGESQPMDCELHEALHQRILERAVALAIKAKTATQPVQQK